MNAAEQIRPLPGAYPTEAWQARYAGVDSGGRLAAHQVTLEVPQGLGNACPPVQLGETGCVYGVRRWGVILRPSALERTGFDPSAFLPSDAQDGDWVRAALDAMTFDLPGGLILASPEFPFQVLGPDGDLRGSDVTARSYLGALAFYVSDGAVDTSFVRLLIEAPASYRQAVQLALAALASHTGPP